MPLLFQPPKIYFFEKFAVRPILPPYFNRMKILFSLKHKMFVEIPEKKLNLIAFEAV
jgi:hypothetical protein